MSAGSRRGALVLAALAVGLASCETRGELIGLGAAEVRLPVEVLGPAGTTRVVQLGLGDREVAAAAALWLELHGLTYPEQGSVAINAAAPIPLDDAHVEVEEPARRYGGIGGPLSIVQLRIPLREGDLRAGPNSLRFRFERTNGRTIGYRVVRLELRARDGSSILPAGRVREEDPALWQAPRPAAADVAEGRRLWREAPLSRPGDAGRAPIAARCADCHTEDGRDLQYFAYSNLAIVERAKFYGLDEAQAERVASYIRSLPVPRLGRPWNPPYQPGPGLDRKPLEAWAAGAGLAAVRPRDADLVAAIFPKGISAAAIATTETLNLRELPIPFPLPDWNRWLPEIHPKDAWGAEFLQHPIAKRYEALRAKLPHATSTDLGATLPGELHAWGVAFVADFRPGKVMGAPRTGELLAKLENTARWQAVKAWELMQEFGLERHASALHAASGEQRSWYPTYGFVSEASPWPPEAPLEEAAAPARSRLAHLYAANAWLAAGAVVHAGSRRHVGSYPLDWAVAQLVERKLQAESGHTRIGRTLALTVKGMQEADNGVGPGTPERGWTFRYANPTPLVSAPAEAWREVSATNRTAIVEAVLSAWLARASAFPPQSYARSEEASQWASPFDVPPADHVPRPRLNGPYPDQLREIIPTLRPLGVDGAIVDALCDFAAAMWPRGDWGALKR